MESEGNIATSVVRPGSRGVAVDRKATLMVQELKRFRMNITGISETKWFGQAVYNVEGTPYSTQDDQFQRRPKQLNEERELALFWTLI